jgi:hypothetical protein
MAGSEMNDDCFMAIAEGLSSLSMLQRLELPGYYNYLHSLLLLT